MDLGRYVLTLSVLFLLGSSLHAQTQPSLSTSLNSNELSAEAAQGKTINEIQIVILPIFNEANPAWLYRQANNFKVSTREATIREELDIAEGSKFDRFQASETARRLRNLRYVRNAQLKVFPSGAGVKILIVVQDTWTLIPQINYSSGTGSTARSIGLAESNLFGRGERFEVSLNQENGRETFETVYDDPRFLGTDNRLVAAYFDRSDGEELFGYFGKPVRTLLDGDTWYVSGTNSDYVGRLYDAGEESYIYRKQINNFEGRYSIPFGDPEVKRSRFTFGLDSNDSNFLQATKRDYGYLNLDPRKVSNEESLVPEDHTYIGPMIGYNYVEPDYVTMNYIDRFDRAEDYNLGPEHGISLSYASEIFGSTEDALLYSLTKSQGVAFSPSSFARGEIGFGGRFVDSGAENTLIRGEAKYFNVMGDVNFLGLWLGRHTFASSLLMEYGNDFDRDRQFVLGADTGLRGYDAQAFTGDRLTVLNVEDRMHVIDDWQELVSVGGAVFADVGGATYSKFQDTVGDDMYADVGIGLRLAFPRSAGGRVLRIDLAFPIRDGPDGSNTWQLRMIFAGGNVFNSHLSSESVGTEKANVGVGFENP